LCKNSESRPLIRARAAWSPQTIANLVLPPGRRSAATTSTDVSLPAALAGDTRVGVDKRAVGIGAEACRCGHWEIAPLPSLSPLPALVTAQRRDLALHLNAAPAGSASAPNACACCSPCSRRSSDRAAGHPARADPYGRESGLSRGALGLRSLGTTSRGARRVLRCRACSASSTRVGRRPGCVPLDGSRGCTGRSGSRWWWVSRRPGTAWRALTPLPRRVERG